MPLTVVRRKSTGALTITGTAAGQRIQRRAEGNAIPPEPALVNSLLTIRG